MCIRDSGIDSDFGTDDDTVSIKPKSRLRKTKKTKKKGGRK